MSIEEAAEVLGINANDVYDGTIEPEKINKIRNRLALYFHPDTTKLNEFDANEHMISINEACDTIKTFLNKKSNQNDNLIKMYAEDINTYYKNFAESYEEQIGFKCPIFFDDFIQVIPERSDYDKLLNDYFIYLTSTKDKKTGFVFGNKEIPYMEFMNYVNNYLFAADYNENLTRVIDGYKEYQTNKVVYRHDKNGDHPISTTNFSFNTYVDNYFIAFEDDIILNEVIFEYNDYYSKRINGKSLPELLFEDYYHAYVRAIDIGTNLNIELENASGMMSWEFMNYFMGNAKTGR